MTYINSKVLKAIVDKTERIKDFYEASLAQRAAIEQFFLDIKEAIMEEVREELVGEDYTKHYDDFEEEMFYAGNDTGVLDSLTRIEQFGMVNDDSQSTLPKQAYAIVEIPGVKRPLMLHPGDKLTISYPQVPLSDSQIMDMYYESHQMIDFARLIEKAHGIGVNGEQA